MIDLVVLDGDCELVISENPGAVVTVADDGEYGSFIKVRDGEQYTGPTVVTPTQETQVLNTAGLIVPANITVNPVPQNYGLITWDGATLTVS